MGKSGSSGEGRKWSMGDMFYNKPSRLFDFLSSVCVALYF